MQTVSVQVQRDHLLREANSRRPILAIAELIWNGLDANATDVRVTFDHNGLDGMDAIRVCDNGEGFTHDHAKLYFGRLGGSWKQGQTRTRGNHRALHGKAGKGRFCAFSLGERVVWNTCFRMDGTFLEFRVEGDSSRLGDFDIHDPVTRSLPETGTEVLITGITRNHPTLLMDEVYQELSELFALYLRAYPDVRIYYHGRRIDPAIVEDTCRDYPIEPVPMEDGSHAACSLTVIEWKIKTERTLYLCDADGFVLHRVKPGIQAPGFLFTAYLKSSRLAELQASGLLILENSNVDVKAFLDTAKAKLRDHFRQKSAEQAIGLVEEWKRDGLYPYSGLPTDVLEQAERQVFEVCALNINSYLPDFEGYDWKAKKITLQLLKVALEESPQALQKVLTEVLELPTEKIEEFSNLLDKASLSAIINASRVITDRLDFLVGLEILLFDASSKQQLLERSQLHKILEQNTWIFGEAYHLAASDQSLDSVLQKHIQLMGRKALNEEPVLRADGTVGIVDLMLSQLIPQTDPKEREYLIIELKRPSQKVDDEVDRQIFSYAYAVAKDERFRETNAKWSFWAVSNDLSETVRAKANQKQRPKGLLYDLSDVQSCVWAKTWGEIIDDCRARLRFFQEKLNYSASQESAQELLRRTYNKYLPKCMKEEEITIEIKEATVSTDPLPSSVSVSLPASTLATELPTD